MNVKKRPRLELATAATATAATDVAYATYSTGNGASTTTNGIFLASGVDVNNGAQIYLTICGDDDNSNESQEFYAIESIKQEPDLDALHALLPTNLQLPTGCEIYLVKDTTTTTTTSPKAHEQLLQKQHQHQQQNQHQQQHAQPMASIKLEPDSIATPSTNVLYVSGSGATTTTHNIVVAASKDSPGSACGSGSGSSSSSLPVASHAAAAAAAGPAIASAGYNVKMDAFKKRDDKRRATHNEVERRRRDKINCWIFKLKEMLPTEGNRYKPMAETLDSKAASMRNNQPQQQQQQQNGRTPPNDSKSQILIKACDYIKSMQNEIDSLRDCLQEAEHLRLSNQALRDELETLKQQQELQERFSTAGGSFNVTLNSLNSSATSDLFDNMDGAANLSAVSSINFTKRGLMISDYDE
ncbi:hypothetical protein AWZ03_010585 [Drosophila navojoa]|uniref:BHLH domain-containing protein n=1 Tax=Drosophila navojoa TaxID=7232 RepID=A0A484B4J1_DRONA|nr:upstream stimulatory factor [Drosophila navojoa]TDG43000.1 hypothetical protein AWZ03_010585 [Drosophila navojoa]